MIAKFSLSVLALCLTAHVSATQALAQQFINALGDVPLASGIHIDEESTIQFENVSGRIIEMQAQFNDWAKIRHFYRETLPSLGWQETPNTQADSLRFLRASETLSFSRDTNTENLMHIRIEPNE